MGKNLKIIIFILLFPLFIINAEELYDSYYYFKKGYDAVDQNNLDEALIYFKKSISLDKTGINGQVYNEIGYVYSLKKDFDNALLNYNKCLDIDNKNLNALINRTNIYIEKKDFIKALENINLIIKIDPKIPLAYYQRGNVLEELKKFQEAEHDYTYFIKITENNKQFNKLRNEAKEKINNLKIKTK